MSPDQANSDKEFVLLQILEWLNRRDFNSDPWSDVGDQVSVDPSIRDDTRPKPSNSNASGEITSCGTNPHLIRAHNTEHKTTKTELSRHAESFAAMQDAIA